DSVCVPIFIFSARFKSFQHIEPLNELSANAKITTSSFSLPHHVHSPGTMLRTSTPIMMISFLKIETIPFSVLDHSPPLLNIPAEKLGSFSSGGAPEWFEEPKNNSTVLQSRPVPHAVDPDFTERIVHRLRQRREQGDVRH